ncbi:MAG: cytochrome c oxidase assembly protein [Acidimicrobiales bacterium]
MIVPGEVGQVTMGNPVIAHREGPLLPHDALAAWSFDVGIIAVLAVTGWTYWQGWRFAQDGARRGSAMLAGLVVVVIALLSPIDAIGGILLSGHMVQHVLLTAVVAPLIAWAAPGAALLRGLPVTLRRRFVTVRRSSGLDVRVMSRLRSPTVRWLLFVAVIWLWHSSALYALAIENDFAHAAQHGSFLGAALLFWTVILGPVRARLAPGLAVLAVFTLTLQGIVLSMLMTFSHLVWYKPYADAATGWGLDPLADQQLAGVIMWIPTGFIHTGIVLALVARWLRSTDSASAAAAPRPEARSASLIRHGKATPRT